MAMTFDTSTLRSHSQQAPQFGGSRFQTQSYTPQRDVGGADTSPRLRIKPVALALVIAIVAIAVIGFGSDAAATSDSAVPTPESAVTAEIGSEAVVPDAIEIYIVQPGDTLWEIASDLAAPGEDVRQLVDALEEIAGGSQLDVGQRLIIDHMLLRS